MGMTLAIGIPLTFVFSLLFNMTRWLFLDWGIYAVMLLMLGLFIEARARKKGSIRPMTPQERKRQQIILTISMLLLAILVAVLLFKVW